MRTTVSPAVWPLPRAPTPGFDVLTAPEPQARTGFEALVGGLCGEFGPALLSDLGELILVRSWDNDRGCAELRWEDRNMMDGLGNFVLSVCSFFSSAVPTDEIEGIPFPLGLLVRPRAWRDRGKARAMRLGNLPSMSLLVPMLLSRPRASSFGTGLLEPGLGSASWL